MGSSTESKSRADVQGVPNLSVLWLIGHREPSPETLCCEQRLGTKQRTGPDLASGDLLKDLGSSHWNLTANTGHFCSWKGWWVLWWSLALKAAFREYFPPQTRRDCSPQSVTASTPYFSRGLRTMMWRLKLFQRRNFLMLKACIWHLWPTISFFIKCIPMWNGAQSTGRSWDTETCNNGQASVHALCFQTLK